MQVDPSFQKAKARAAKRKRQKRMRIVWIALGALAVIGLIGGLGTWAVMSWPSGGGEAMAAAEGEGEQFVQVEDDTTAAPIRAATPFVDIPGDPLILRFAEEDGGAAQTVLAGPMTLDARRIGDPRPDRLTLVSEPLIVQERQLITALPSSREDFAFFQAQRSNSLDATPAALNVAEVPGSDDDLAVVTVASDDEDDSFGIALGGEGAAETVTYRETRVENTTSVAFVKPEAQRTKLYEDVVIRLVTERSLKDVLIDNDFGGEEMAAQILPLIPQAELLAPGSIVAIRGRPQEDGLLPLQLSVYGPDGYVGSVARRGNVGYALAADPWVGQDLFALSAPQQDAAPAPQDYRLLDAVYSAVIRKGVPTTLTGELIVMLSQAYDLEAFAAPGDQITVLYAPQPGPVGPGPGQILYVGLKGPSGDMPCYVTADDEGKYSCLTPKGRAGAGGTTGTGGITTPVQGTLTSPFGPRHHPILKTVRLHAGVDWAAPTGTPIVAALAGTLNYVGDGGGYGQVIYIDHPGGLQSRYAHMSRYADGMRAGVEVAAGQVIGYVGTTGRSTGPHLHFEIRQGGEPVDPLSVNVTTGTVVAAAGGGASEAVEALVNQIIKVESAGNANAKNPLSTATGLGQFIESTWLRMMQDYRPDLASTMSRADLLALRTDPTLSREMVTNLARENERFLSGRGHSISAGRLYLAHFLGPGGANKVLSSQDGQTILAVMGQGVVSANPFLRNYTVADLKAWADRKMVGATAGGGGGGGATVVVAAAPVLTAEMKAYMELIDEVVAGSG